MEEDLTEKIGKRLGNISDLPEELRKQLQITKTDELEDVILEVMKELEGIANTDEILVGIYRKTKKIIERTFLSNKMYRMGKTGHIISVAGKKGVYKVI